MAEERTNDDPGERLAEMVSEWAEAYSKEQGGRAGEPREEVTRAFMAGAVTVIQRWDEVRPLVPRRRVSWRDLPSHHG